MNNPSGSNQQGEDYLDKAVDSLERKFGQGKVDPVKMRSTNEKFTDKARQWIEKMTGKKVPSKISN